ncbi:MAG: DUF5640 domain-containing protein [Chthoniobacterales bacterium]
MPHARRGPNFSPSFDMKKFFGFGSSTPPPPAPPSKPPSPPAMSPAPAAAKTAATAPAPAAPSPAAPPAPPIVGRWRDASGTGDGSESTEFNADGSVTERLAGGDTIRGRYLLSGDNLTINLEGMEEALDFTAMVRQDTLEMTDAGGQRSTYRRA